MIKRSNKATIPSSWYFDQKIFKKELDYIFNNSWHLIGPESLIPNLGDTYPIEICNQPIVISRGKGNKINVFYNVCQHRGTVLLNKKKCYKQFQCKYHGWLYDLNGNLLKARGFESSEMKKEDFKLKSINVKIWNKLIFINFSENTTSFKRLFDRIDKRIGNIDFSEYHYFERVSYPIKCNWKVYLDNYLEGFHIPLVHKELSKVLDYKSYETELYDDFSLQWCNIKNEENPYLDSGISKPVAYYFTVFPNILLNIAPGRLQTNIVEPKSSKTCTVHFDYFFSSIDKRSIKKDMDFSNLIQKEDVEICEAVQRGIESKGYDIGQISEKYEAGLHHFQSILKDYLN